jgi:hypothetical protein
MRGIITDRRERREKGEEASEMERARGAATATGAGLRDLPPGRAWPCGPPTGPEGGGDDVGMVACRNLHFLKLFSLKFPKILRNSTYGVKTPL